MGDATRFQSEIAAAPCPCSGWRVDHAAMEVPASRELVWDDIRLRPTTQQSKWNSPTDRNSRPGMKQLWTKMNQLEYQA